MSYHKGKVFMYAVAASAMVFSTGIAVSATELASAVPMGGVSMGIAEEKTEHMYPQSRMAGGSVPEKGCPKAKNDDDYICENMVIAQVNEYVNIRMKPDKKSEALGKLYNHSAGVLLGTQGEWYLIRSGNVTGYVMAEYCITGQEALELSAEVGTRIAKVGTTTLRVRTEPDAKADTLCLIPMDDELLVLDEENGWVKVDTEEGEGYVSSEFVTLKTEFVQAESREEEKARLEKEEEERKAAQEAAAREAAKKAAKKAAEEAANGKKDPGKEGADVPVSDGSDLGEQVVAYAVQFVGNPYKYGGTSLTNGIDCSGFTMKVYENFGVSLPHSSGAYRNIGTAVDGIANAKPGDIIVYSGHVAIYMGDNQVVHASNKKDGIKISDADYKKYLSIRRIF